MGGVHKFMRWNGPILTDSGGFQVFSHNEFMKLTNEGVSFRAIEYDGARIRWTPEDNMAIAEKLGSDICMQLDQCPGYPATKDYVARAVELSSMWGERCWNAHTRPDQALFGIVQGGMHMDLRLRSLAHLEECGDFPGYGIGGYSVGEDHETMYETLEPLVAEHMPKNKPRYLMGVGNPTTLVRAVASGVDMFDCVLPTRTARMGTAFSSEGRLTATARHARAASRAPTSTTSCARGRCSAASCCRSTTFATCSPSWSACAPPSRRVATSSSTETGWTLPPQTTSKRLWRRPVRPIGGSPKSPRPPWCRSPALPLGPRGCGFSRYLPF